MTFVMFDSVTLSEIPGDATAVAGYVGGLFPTFSKLATDFPHAQVLSVAVNAGEDAECLDVETGDATPSEAPAWWGRQRARGVNRPCFYANTSTMPSVIAALSGAGIKRAQYRLWTAHYTGQAHIEVGSDATQWTDKAFARNLDQSLCEDDFLGGGGLDKKTVVNQQHYEWFDNTTRSLFGSGYSERATVLEYDKLRAKQTPRLHPRRARLAVLRLRLRRLAGRVLTVAKSQMVNGKPSYGVDHRGWRFQQLIHRAQGQRFV